MSMSSPGIPITSSLSPSSDLSLRKCKQLFNCLPKTLGQPSNLLHLVSPCLSFPMQSGTMSLEEDQSTSMLFSHLSMPSHQLLSTLSLLDCTRSNPLDHPQPQKKFKTLEIGSWHGGSLPEQSSMHSPIMNINSENMEKTSHNFSEQFHNQKQDMTYSSMKPLGPLSEDVMTSFSLTMEALNTSKLPASQITGPTKSQH